MPDPRSIFRKRLAREFLPAINAALDDYEEAIKREVREKFREMRRKQRHASIPAYGDDPKRPEEKLGLDLMLRMRREGATIRSIMAAMERNEFKNRKDKGWNPGSIIRVLRRHHVK